MRVADGASTAYQGGDRWTHLLPMRHRRRTHCATSWRMSTTLVRPLSRQARPWRRLRRSAVSFSPATATTTAVNRQRHRGSDCPLGADFRLCARYVECEKLAEVWNNE